MREKAAWAGWSFTPEGEAGLLGEHGVACRVGEFIPELGLPLSVSPFRR